MNARNDIDDTAERLRDALGAADLMLKGRERADPPALAPAPLRRPRPGRAWLVPLAAGAAVVAVVLASVLAVGAIGGRARNESAPAVAAGPPEFYLTLDTASHGSPLEVRRTSEGTITGSTRLPGEVQNSDFSADASGRAFYVASFLGCAKATRLYRITINNSGWITGYHTVGSPVGGTIVSLAVSPDGSRMAYTISSTGSCGNSQATPEPVTTIHVMDLSTGAVRTWRNTVTAPEPQRVTQLVNGLSWTPNGRTVVATARWGGDIPAESNEISVLGLDATGPGGSLQSSSRALLSQNEACVTCVQDAIAGPDGSLTAVVFQQHGEQQRQMVVRIWPGTGRPPTVLYSAAAPPAVNGDIVAVFADPSGRWVITWPPDDLLKDWAGLRAGWIRNSRLVSLPGTGSGYPDSVAW
jgi:hypothetical protein